MSLFNLGADLLNKRKLWAISIPWYGKVDVIYYLSFWFVPIMVPLAWGLIALPPALVIQLVVYNHPGRSWCNSFLVSYPLG